MSTEGFLSLYIGNMFSGKTTCTLKELTMFAELTNTKVLLINHSLDNRDITNKISTHNPTFKNTHQNIDIVSSSTLSSVDVSSYLMIGIDEAQFFQDLYDTIVNNWLPLGKRIVAAGLNGNAKKELFGDIYRLIPHVDDLKFCTAICKLCISEFGTDKILTPQILETMKAPFTKKIAGDLEMNIEVGNGDKYIPLCRRHYDLN